MMEPLRRAMPALRWQDDNPAFAETAQLLTIIALLVANNHIILCRGDVSYHGNLAVSIPANNVRAEDGINLFIDIGAFSASRINFGSEITGASQIL